MAARIRFRDALGREGLIELGGDVVYVGRAPDCAIRSDDALVSRRHSRIKREGHGFWIEDLDSSNGTKVNNARVQKQQLKNDDAVICGSLTLLYMEDAMPAAAATMMAPAIAMPAPPTMMAPAAHIPSMPFAPPAATMPSVSELELQKLRDSVDSLRLELDEARSLREKEVAENMRLRAEHLRFQQRLEDAQTQLHDNAEVVEGHKRLVEELRPEIDIAYQSRDKAQRERAEANQQVTSMTHQLARAQEEIVKLKGELDKHKRMIVELSAAKEDLHKKLNEQLSEVEHVRQVVREQERMLEERRVGLINLEDTLRQLRQK